MGRSRQMSEKDIDLYNANLAGWHCQVGQVDLWNFGVECPLIIDVFQKAKIYNHLRFDCC